MIVNLLVKILVSLINLIGFVISPIINLIPTEPFQFIDVGVTAIQDLIIGSMGLVRYVFSDYAWNGILIALSLRILSLNQATLINIMKKIPYIKSFFKE